MKKKKTFPIRRACLDAGPEISKLKKTKKGNLILFRCHKKIILNLKNVGFSVIREHAKYGWKKYCVSSVNLKHLKIYF